MISFAGPCPINLCPYATNRASWRHTYVTLTFAGIPDLIHSLAEAHNAVNHLEEEVSDLKNQMRVMRNRMGMIMEAVAPQHPNLAHQFGLVLQHDNPPTTD